MASYYIRLPLQTSGGGGPSSNVNVVSSVLPTGASTAANQAATNTKLDTIAANTSKSAVKNYYNEVLAVPVGVLTVLVTKNVTANSKLTLASFSGTNWGEYRVLLNGSVLEKVRTNVSGAINSEVSFSSGVALVSGDVVQVSVLNSRTSAGDYNARLLIEE